MKSLVSLTCQNGACEHIRCRRRRRQSEGSWSREWKLAEATWRSSFHAPSPQNTWPTSISWRSVSRATSLAKWEKRPWVSKGICFSFFYEHFELFVVDETLVGCFHCGQFLKQLSPLLLHRHPEQMSSLWTNSCCYFGNLENITLPLQLGWYSSGSSRSLAVQSTVSEHQWQSFSPPRPPWVQKDICTIVSILVDAVSK